MARGRTNAPLVAVAAAREDAELSQVEAFASDLSDEFLECRELGHLWRPFTAEVTNGGFHRVLKCRRCTTEREQDINSRGVVLSNRYVHPDGYLNKGMGRIVGDGRGVLRIESITRQVEAHEKRSKAAKKGAETRALKKGA